METTSPVMSITDEQIAEIEALANGAGGIEWYASTAYCSNADKESLAIYYRPHPFHCVEIVETPDSDPENGECIHSKEYWAFIGSAHPAALLALISRLRAAEMELSLWSPIIDEVHRRAGKECCLEDQCDFTVTVAYEDYAVIDTAMKGEQQ